MNLTINLNLRPSLKPTIKENGKPFGTSQISYSEARNLPTPMSMKNYDYIVKKGDNLSSIAEKFNISPVQLSEWLREKRGHDYVNEGDKISIPTLLEER